MKKSARLVIGCALAGAFALGVGARSAAAVVITDPTNTVSVGTSGDSGCAQATVAVSLGDCTNGFVAVSATGNSWGGAAVSGTGTANTDSDTTPVAVSGTNEAGGCGDLGAYSVSGTGYSQGCAAAVSVAGTACGSGSPSANVTVLGTACSSPGALTICPRCLLGLDAAATAAATTSSWQAPGTRRF